MKTIDESNLFGNDEIIFPFDAFVRSVGIRRQTPHALFLGAGASVSSGIPSAQFCIWEWKRSIFLTNNLGLENQFAELSLPSVQRRIQGWLDKQGTYPQENALEEYGFYIEQCFPIAADRKTYFQEKVRNAQPHIGYRLICHLAEADLIRSLWTTNFDGLAARAAANFKLTPFEVGIDTQNRILRTTGKGELLCVSLHGDYRYDDLMNTVEELQAQEAALRVAMIDDLRNTSLIVCGYSGRDKSVMDAFRAAYEEQGSGVLYWCGFSDGNVPEVIAQLIAHARAHGRQAYYVPTLGFDDLLTRLGLHCLEGERREVARQDIAEFAPKSILEREPFKVGNFPDNTLIKSNAFEIDCPSEVLAFDLKEWPKEKVWSAIRNMTGSRPVVAVPSRSKVLAIGTIDDIKVTFGDNIKGLIERTPVGPDELRYEDGAIVSLMREAVVRLLSDADGVDSDGRKELWLRVPIKTIRQDNIQYRAYESVVIFLRRIGAHQYLILKPSIKVLDDRGVEVAREIAAPIKLGILGYQHNKPFNQVVNKWRSLFFPKEKTNVFEFPKNCGSTFRFTIRRTPDFGQIGLSKGSVSVSIPNNMRSLIKHRGFELPEPQLVFSNKTGSGVVKDVHPVRGMVQNRPYDYPLTARGLAPSLRLGIVCPRAETQMLRAYLAKAHQTHQPTDKERDYLMDYAGFQEAYGLPLELPDPGQSGWVICSEPTSNDSQFGSVELAKQINTAVDALQSSCAPHVVLIFFPDRWSHLRGYRTESERFDVHDFVKAFCVQRGIASQFLNQDTLANTYQCRVWWWLSLALYVKGMRTPWVLDTLDDDTAYVGLGFSIDQSAENGRHVVLGCSHIYSARGEGLQYRLSKVENPIIRRGNPYMSKSLFKISLEGALRR